MSSGLSISPMSWSFKTKHLPLGASSVVEHTMHLYGRFFERGRHDSPSFQRAVRRGNV